MALLTTILGKYKRSHATEPPLIVQQIGAGPLQTWHQGEAGEHGTEKARINNDGSFSLAGLTISGATPTLLFEDTTGGEADFQFVANANSLLLEVAGGTDIATFSGSAISLLLPTTISGTLQSGDLTISDATPKLVLQDTTASEADFEWEADANTLTH